MPALIANDGLRIDGTLIIMAVGKDGIIIAADSRTDITKNALEDTLPLAYFDSTEKITALRHYAVAITGMPATNMVDLAERLEEFDSANAQPLPLTQYINAFYRYLYSQIPRSDFLAFRDTYIIFTGYDNDLPRIVITKISEDGMGFRSIESKDSTVSSWNASPYFKYAKGLSCYKLGKMAEKSIYAFAKENHRQNKIGGPISILKINPDGTKEWIQNDFSKHIQTQWDMLKLYKLHRLKITYLQAGAERIVDSMFKTNFPTILGIR